MRPRGPGCDPPNAETSCSGTRTGTTSAMPYRRTLTPRSPASVRTSLRSPRSIGRSPRSTSATRSRACSRSIATGIGTFAWTTGRTHRFRRSRSRILNATGKSMLRTTSPCSGSASKMNTCSRRCRDIERSKAVLARQLGVALDAPDTWAHGYPTERVRLVEKESRNGFGRARTPCPAGLSVKMIVAIQS